jgi:hypothetical protein
LFPTRCRPHTAGFLLCRLSLFFLLPSSLCHLGHPFAMCWLMFDHTNLALLGFLRLRLFCPCHQLCIGTLCWAFGSWSGRCRRGRASLSGGTGGSVESGSGCGQIPLSLPIGRFRGVEWRGSRTVSNSVGRSEGRVRFHELLWLFW